MIAAISLSCFLVALITQPLDTRQRNKHRRANPKAMWHPPTKITWINSIAWTLGIVIPLMHMDGVI